MANSTNRWRKIGTFLQGLPVFWILFGIAVFAVLFELGRREIDTKDAYLLNVYTEFLGVAATVLIVNAWYRNRDEQRRLIELKERLLHEVCSPNNATAIEAIHELRKQGWLCGRNGLLCGQDLTRSSPTLFSMPAHGAKLEKAQLSCANLQGTHLDHADLEGAVLTGAALDSANLPYVNLQDADLLGASLRKARLNGSNLSRSHLEGAHLDCANLEGANLCQAFMRGASANFANFKNAKLDRAFLWNASFHGADLENASLTRVNFFDGGSLESANLTGCDLAGAHIEHCEFNENTILPDGTKWTPNVDLKLFTNPEHQEVG